MKNILVIMGLLISTGTMAEELIPECVNYLKESDALIVPALKKANLTPEQMKIAKAQYEEGKKQLANLTKEQQIQACSQGLEQIKQVKQSQKKSSK